MGSCISKEDKVIDDDQSPSESSRDNHPPPPPPSPRQPPRPPPRPPILTPDDVGFHTSVNGRNGLRVNEVYDMTSAIELGRGAFGAVYKAKHKYSRIQTSDEDPEETDEFRPEWHQVAIKKTKPNALDLRNGRVIHTYDELEQHCQEIRTILRLQEGVPPRLSQTLYLYEYFWTGHETYMVTELLEMELDEWRQDVERFTERDAIDICRTILQGIQFIHSRGVMHRDIKLQNILFKKTGDFRSLKIVDFGLARTLEPGEKARDFCGSIGYISPEIYRGKPYGFEVDMFAFGVLLFRLLSGERPFPSNNSQVLKRHTIELRYNVQGSDWEGVSSAAKDMVRNLLINEQQRLTAEDALQHRWFKEVGQSVLRTDLTHVGDEHDSRSRAFLFSQAPTATVSKYDGSRFWVDSSIQMALATILSYGIYSARVVDISQGDDGGLICVEEIAPPINTPVPDFVSQRDVYTEKECRDICRKLAECINILHNTGIAHRNLHIENVLVDPWGQVSIRGLQYAQPILDNQPLTGHFGFLYSWYAFKAPEIDSEFVHDKSVDLWSLGAIMYMLLTGLPPFRGSGTDLIAAKHSGEIDFSVVPVSGPAERLVRGLLRVVAYERYTIEQVLNDEWMVEADDYLSTFDLSIALEGMRDFRKT